MEETKVAQGAEQQNATEQNKVSTPEVTVSKTEGTMRAEVQTIDPMADPDADKEKQQTDDKPEQQTQEEVQKEWEQQQQTEKDVKADLATKGVDFDALAKEYDEKGELSDESMKALEKAGYPKSVVDAYIDGLNAKTERFVATVKGFAGGDKEFEQLRVFMSSQPQNVIDGFNAAIQTGNLSQIQLAIEGIKAQMVKAYGTSNPTIMANRQTAGAAAGYTSVAEMTKDMSDPRYQQDPEFTRNVIRRIKNATFF